MEVADALRRRRMVRHYDGRPVPDDALARIVDAARRAPTAGHAQGQHVVIVASEEGRRAVAARCHEAEHVARGRPPWLSSAPVHLVLCARPQDYRDRYAAVDKAAPERPDAWPVPFWWVDAGQTLMALQLAAVDEGLAAGFLDIADRAGLRRDLAIPDEVEPIGVLTVGYPGDRDAVVGSARRPRRPRTEVLHVERWGADPPRDT
ncbi:nitroreductase [Egibacter rhizosphaerae]|uniref:Nitroreductase n=1 Tax=Egibacter rhizosphaerae TaxID=1670831 RepID=A0A411YKD7_9ACTN|nr:nitroreductase family protein [Egibacter rhizosphaerae]QBI21641.1 nitroreductase [Egibacter rhizosphaerae]